MQNKYHNTSIRASAYYWAYKIFIGLTNRGVHYMRYYGIKAHYFTIIEEGGRTIQRDFLIKESALNELIRYV